VASQPDINCTAPFMPLDDFEECDEYERAEALMDTYQVRIY